MSFDKEELKTLLLTVDERLAQSGLTIPQRPINALREVALAMKLPLPLSEPPPGMEHESAKYWPISEFVHSWYDQRYGDRVKMDFCPGMLAASIRNDIYVGRMPLFFGDMAVFIDRKRIDTPSLSKKGPVLFNALDAFEDLPQTIRDELSDPDLALLHALVCLGVEVTHRLESLSRESDLVRLARADSNAAALHLKDSKREYALSKWASLQAAEKLLKFGIKQCGASFPHVHKLDDLRKLASTHGLAVDGQEEIKLIQCSAGVRYGEVEVSEGEALDAHHAAFRLAGKIFAAIERRPQIR